jgi:hypothetical protein
MLCTTTFAPFSEGKRQPSAANLPEAVGTYRAGGFNP